jgi:hypothetical protein
VTQILPTHYDLVETLYYSTKDITRKGYDFMDVVYFPPTKRTNIKTDKNEKETTLPQHLQEKHDILGLG